MLINAQFSRERETEYSLLHSEEIAQMLQHVYVPYTDFNLGPSCCTFCTIVSDCSQRGGCTLCIWIILGQELEAYFIPSIHWSSRSWAVSSLHASPQLQWYLLFRLPWRLPSTDAMGPRRDELVIRCECARIHTRGSQYKLWNPSPKDCKQLSTKSSIFSFRLQLQSDRCTV